MPAEKKQKGRFRAGLKQFFGTRTVHPTAEKHFKSKDPDWNKFDRGLESAKFRNAIIQDPRADTKLKKFVAIQGRVMKHQGPSMNVMSTRGTGDSYQVQYHKDLGRYMCTCPDFKYSKGLAKKDCKHIKAVKAEGGLKTSADEEAMKDVFMSAFHDELEKVALVGGFFDELEKIAKDDLSIKEKMLRGVDTARPYFRKAVSGAVPGTLLGSAVGALSGRGAASPRYTLAGMGIGAGLGMADQALEDLSERRKYKKLLQSYHEKESSMAGDLRRTHVGGAKMPTELSKGPAVQRFKESRNVGRFGGMTTRKSVKDYGPTVKQQVL
jgi:predicted nucleic acid-binding Zn finger protein